MLKTDHNLKTLERKIRRAVALIEELRQRSSTTPGSKEAGASYGDLPLLQGLEQSKHPRAEPARETALREEVRRRIAKMMRDIEKMVG